MKRLNKRIRIKGPHKWIRSSKGPQWDKQGTYRNYTCRVCGVKGKQRTFHHVELEESTIKNFSKKIINNCATNIDLGVPSAVEIKTVNTNWPEYKNLTPGSIHSVVKPPFPNVQDWKSVWVMGVGEPVRIFKNEYEVFLGTRTKFNHKK